MHLSRLVLKGFKSFAKPTILQFEPGMTAIVGPNGSGKSNIVDALSWVMGEQGAKNLRGTSMEDVIFAGTAQCPPAGRAQVLLTIDNSDRALDVDYTEVTISRTVYRSGGSEYAINGSPVHLGDVQDLLSDAGMGAHMHVIIGQGRLDQVLRANSQENKNIIEEAAGILKYRKRKEKAFRKLQATEDNLLRLQDLLAEMKRQAAPLEKQAQLSRQASAIKEEIFHLTCLLLANKLKSLSNQRHSNNTQLISVRNELNATTDQLNRLRYDIEKCEKEVENSHPELSVLANNLSEYEKLDERYRGYKKLLTEKLALLKENIPQPHFSDSSILQTRLSELRELQKATEEERTEEEKVYEKSRQERAQCESLLAQKRQELIAARNAKNEEQQNFLHLQQQISEKRATLRTSSERYDDLKERKNSLEKDNEDVARELVSLTKNLQKTAAVLDGPDVIESLYTQRDDYSKRSQDITTELREYEHKQARLQTRVQVLRETINTRHSHTQSETTQGLQKSYKAQDTSLLQSSATSSFDENLDKTDKKSETTSIFPCTIASLFTVKSGWEKAVTQILGNFANATVFLDWDNYFSYQKGDIKNSSAIVLESQHLKNYLHSLSSRLDRSRTSSVGTKDITSLWNQITIIQKVEGSSKEQERYDQRREVIADLFRYLLGSVACVSSLEEGIQCFEDTYWNRAITQQGEIIYPYGISQEVKSATSDVELMAEIHQLDEELEQISHKITLLTNENNDLSHDMEKIVKEIQEKEYSIQQTRNAYNEIQFKVNIFEKKNIDNKNEVKKINANITEIENSISEDKNQLTQLESNLKLLQEGFTTYSYDEAISQEQKLSERVKELVREEIENKQQYENSQKKVDSIIRQISLLQTQIEDSQKQEKKYAQECSLHQQRQEKAKELLIAIEVVSRALYRSLCEEKEIYEKRSQATSTQLSELAQLRQTLSELEKPVQELRMQEHSLDIERERLATLWGELLQKVEDRIGEPWQEVINKYASDNSTSSDDGSNSGDLENSDNKSIYDKESISDEESSEISEKTRRDQEERNQQLLEKARQKLSDLGKINPLAVEEYAALEERKKDLEQQMADIEHSRKNLLDIIAQLEHIMKENFISAYHDTAQAFKEIFSLLFPGGRGELILEDKENPLDSGILVEANPAGKKMRKLSLLSGGERSLTALALLFAVFVARPSPFYVMDEIEAALDDINLTRLLTALKAMSKNTQMIVITHQQRTMAIASALYGVTLKSDGSSEVISEKLT